MTWQTPVGGPAGRPGAGCPGTQSRRPETAVAVGRVRPG